MDPHDHVADISPRETSPATDLTSALVTIRRPLTVLLGRSQLLQRRIRHGRITAVSACLPTLRQLDELVFAIEARLRTLEGVPGSGPAASVGATDLLGHTPDLGTAVADAAGLVVASGGTDLDPILRALDRRLLAQDGEGMPPLVVHLRRDLMTVLDLSTASDLSARQVAARVLCSGDDRIRVPLLAAQVGGLTALVPTIAVTLFGGLRPMALEMASPLAALVHVNGLGGCCTMLGRPLAVDRLGPAQTA
jgi:hypothetical protein